MRRIVTLIAAVVLLIPALPAAAGKPVVTDYAEFTWGDGNYIRYADGFVEVSYTETSYVECAGGMLLQTVSLTGTTTGTLEMKNHLRSGTLSFSSVDLENEAIGGCDLSAAGGDSGTLAIAFDFLDSTVDRRRDNGLRSNQRSGVADLVGSVTAVSMGTTARSSSDFGS